MDKNTITGPFGTEVHIELVHTKEAQHKKLGTLSNKLCAKPLKLIIPLI